jgi:holliday junction DNA helicase RuvA
MIERISGTVAKITDGQVVIMVGGVGISVRIPKTVMESVQGIGDMVLLYTYLVVREDELTLYGFIAEQEREIFETLITVNGVGPRMGIAVLGTISVDQLRNAVARGEPDLLTRVPGIGKKTAEKIIFELKGKLKATSGLAQLMPSNDVDADVVAALTSLGYSIVEAQTAIQNIPRDAPQDVESRVMLALQYFQG